MEVTEYPALGVLSASNFAQKLHENFTRDVAAHLWTRKTSRKVDVL